MTILWGLSFVFAMFVLSYFVANIFSDSTDIGSIILFSMIVTFGLVTLLNFIFCVYILRKFARRNLKKYIYISYACTFLLSGVLGVLSCIYFFFNALWYSTNVDDYFAYESQRLPALCPEYNLRLKFNSGKIVNLHLDPCGHSDYKVYKLDDGNIYMESKGRQFSYLVELTKEEVYAHSGNFFYKLNGEAISGFGGSSNTITTFSTYKGSLDNDRGSFSAKAQDFGDILDNKVLLGDLETWGFIKIDNL
ncbi:MAG: hypothetical protein R3Y46_07940 [Opitutales bacterium]